DELQFGIFLSQIPGAFGTVDDISVANVIVEMAHALVESNDASQRQGAFDGDGRLRCQIAIQDQAVQPAFADRFHNFHRPLRLPAILHNDVLKFPPQEVFDQRFVFGLDFNEVRQNAERRPIQAANGIEKPLDRFRTVRTLYCKIADGLQPVANTFFVGLRFGCSPHSIGEVESVSGICLLHLRQLVPEAPEPSLLARIFVSRGNQLLFERRCLFSCFGFLAFESLNLGRDSADRFFPAQKFITNLRLPADDFELLLPKVFDRALFRIAPLHTIGNSSAGASDVFFDYLLVLVDAGQLLRFRLRFSPISLEIRYSTSLLSSQCGLSFLERFDLVLQALDALNRLLVFKLDTRTAFTQFFQLALFAADVRAAPMYQQIQTLDLLLEVFALTPHQAERDLDLFLLVHQHLGPCRKHSGLYCPHAISKFDVPACLAGLTLERISLPVDFGENVVHTREIESGCFK